MNSMNKRTDLNTHIERTLNSLDGIQRAEPGAWFYNRVAARLNREETSAWSVIARFLARPAVTVCGIVTVLVINLVLLVQPVPDTFIQEMASGARPADSSLNEPEYVMANNSSFDSENLLQP